MEGKRELPSQSHRETNAPNRTQRAPLEMNVMNQALPPHDVREYLPLPDWKGSRQKNANSSLLSQAHPQEMPRPVIPRNLQCEKPNQDFFQQNAELFGRPHGLEKPPLAHQGDQ